MRIPTSETEVGYVRAFSKRKHGAIYKWTSVQTTYGLNYTYGRDTSRKMTWSEFLIAFPHQSGWGREYRTKEPCKYKW